MSANSLTESLAEWLVSQRNSRIPDELMTVAQYYVLDWLGSALAGGATETGQALTAYARDCHWGQYTIVGQGVRSSAEGAALANGGLSHIMEMDDLDRSSVVHPGAVIIPAALAAAEQQGANGRQFLSAVAAGYEVAIRIGQAVGKRHYYYFHNTATCGVFGAAAAAGWLFGLDEQQLAWALGSAGTQSAGLWEFNQDGAMSKPLHAGMAAANGIRAASLARRGFTGTRFILEGEKGFFAATAPGARPGLVLHGLGDDDLRITGVSIKPHASCRHTHPAIDAALSIHGQLGQSRVETVCVDTYQAALNLCDNPKPESIYAAKFSLQFCVATALIRGKAGLNEFTLDAIASDTLQPLISQVQLALEPAFEAEYPVKWSTRVNATLSDGRKLSAAVQNPKGDPENPLNSAELRAKFHQMAAHGGHGHNSKAWVRWVDGLLSSQTVTVPEFAVEA